MNRIFHTVLVGLVGGTRGCLPEMSQSEVITNEAMPCGHTKSLVTELSLLLTVPARIAGGGVSFVAIWAVIRTFMKYIQKGTYRVFYLYRVAPGILVAVGQSDTHWNRRS